MCKNVKLVNPDEGYTYVHLTIFATSPKKIQVFKNEELVGRKSLDTL